MGRYRYTQKDFLDKARKVHGNKYDYSKVNYVNSKTKVCIICPEHGEFWQIPTIHLQGCGCPKCAVQKTSDKRRLSNEEFIRRAREVHGNKYDYSKVEYINHSSKVCIICPEHGEFCIMPGNHLNGEGCRKCSFIKKTKSQEEFIKDAIKMYGDRYDYSKVEYKGNKIKVCIICPEHGEFWITPNNFLRGHNCNGIHTNKLTTEQFIEKARKVHGNKYDYSKVNYVNSKTPVCIICPEHGEFWQEPRGHLRGYGCIKCSPNSLKDNKYFIEKARKVHGDKYDYSKVNYVNSKTKVCIICPEHGEFWQVPTIHLKGCGCPSCNNSHLETEIFNILNENKINFIREKTFQWLRNKGNLFLDFYLPDYKIAIECQGEQHFAVNHFFGDIKELLKTQYRDYIKFDKCKCKKIKVVYFIPYDFEKYGNEFYNDKNCFKEGVKLINFIKNGVY